MSFNQDRLKNIFGAMVYALLTCLFIRFFLVNGIIWSDWGYAHLGDPSAVLIWYPFVAALTGLLGWLDRKIGIWGFGIVASVRLIENLLAPQNTDYHFDFVVLVLFVPMVLPVPFALLCKFFMFLEPASGHKPPSEHH